jgi:hypothetical protein
MSDFAFKISALSETLPGRPHSPEAGALPGCATLRHQKSPYHIRFSPVNAQSLDRNKREQNEHTGQTVPTLYRVVQPAFVRRSSRAPPPSLAQRAFEIPKWGYNHE